jgi:hypothetical protein
MPEQSSDFVRIGVTCHQGNALQTCEEGITVFEQQNRPASAQPRQPEQSEKSIPTFTKVFAVVFVIVLLYVGYIFWSRAQEKAAFEQQAAQRKAAQAAADQKTVAGMGGDEFKILRFYAYPSQIARGDSTDICYGVSNAASVTLQPQTSAVWPAFNKCVTVSPRKTTEYTFTATDAAGHTQQQKITVEVR